MSTEDSAVEVGTECNTPVLTSFALNIYDVNIVIDNGVELKEKSPPFIYRFMFWRLKSTSMVFWAKRHIIILC